MNDPIFSVIAPAIRPENYKQCYDSFCGKSDITFEMIFIGNNPPTEFIGEHFRYIYSTVKPAQCLEIGARESQGKYILPMADDVKYTYNFLDVLYEEISNLDTDKYILSFMGFPAGKLGNMSEQIKKYQGYPYDKYIFNSPNIPWSACCPRSLWYKIGGIDRRFIHPFYDVDLYMRLYEIGFDFKLAKDIYVREFYPKFGSGSAGRKRFKETRMLNKYKDYSRSLLNSFWVNPDGTMSKKRLLPVESFEDKDIMTVTQGEKGEWQ